MQPHKPKPPITKQYLIVGEGTRDGKFLEELCKAHNITDFMVEDAGAGNSSFQQYFEGLLGRSGLSQLKGVVVMSDNDESPDDSFKKVRVQLKKAGVPYPENPYVVVRDKLNDFALAVLMIPQPSCNSSKGCLETVILPAAKQRHEEIAKCAAAFESCVGVESWPKLSGRDKFRLRCILSAANPDDPNIGIHIALEPSKNLISLLDPCFEPIVRFLRDFPEEVSKLGQ